MSSSFKAVHDDMRAPGWVPVFETTVDSDSIGIRESFCGITVNRRSTNSHQSLKFLTNFSSRCDGFSAPQAVWIAQVHKKK
jgi:hypothetical protein